MAAMAATPVAVAVAASPAPVHPRAFSSPLVVNTGGDTDGHYFGYAWHEIVRGARGFSVRVDTMEGEGVARVLSAETIERGDTRLVQSGGHHHFLLLPGEFVTRVDVAAGDTAILALRFTTTLRASQWLGRTGMAPAANITALVAPDGFIIKLLQGTQTYNHCLQLGALFSPLAAEPSALDNDRDAAVPGSVAFSGIRLHGPKAKQATHFKRFSPTLRAVVVDCPDARVASVHVLSAHELAFFETVSDTLHMRASEHVFVLVEGERITAIAYHAAKGCGIVGVRFQTTMRTSLWFGRAPLADDPVPPWFPNDVRRDSFVCGFHGAESDGKLNGIGPVFYTPAVAHAHRGDSVAAVDKSAWT